MRNTISDLRLVNKVDHIGMAVPSLDKALIFYKKIFGCEADDTLSLPDDGLLIAFIQLENLRIELLQPVGGDSPIKGLLEGYTVNQYIKDNPSGGMHHVCYGVSNLFEIVQKIQNDGGRILGDGRDWLGADGNPITFIDPEYTDGILLELKEK